MSKTFQCTCRDERHTLPYGATVDLVDVFADGSGAPAVVRVGEYTWAFDMLGETSCKLIGGPTGYRSRKSFAIAINKARSAYAMALGHETDASWIERNAAMYAERAS